MPVEIDLALVQVREFTDKVTCDQCASRINIQVNNLKRQLKKWSGSIYCRSCAAKISYERSGKAKKDATMLEKYGVVNAQQFLNFKIQAKATAEAKYGEGGSAALARSAFKEKYGFSNPMDIPGVQDKTRETFLKNYGVEHPNKLAKNKKRLQQVMLSRFGQGSILRARLLHRNGDATIEEFAARVATFLEKNNLPPASKIAEDHFQTSYSTLLMALRLIDREDLINKYSNTSSKERELRSFLQSVYSGAIEFNNRSILGGKELDIYLPDLNLAIEFNGLYWHSEKLQTDKNYHYKKYQECLKQGIMLYTVFEHEWNTQRGLLERFFKRLVKPDAAIFARKTTITNSTDSLKEFIKENHLQGLNRNSTEYMGLEYNGEIVLAVSFGPHHRNREETVLNRVCFGERGVVGGFNKILHAVRFPFITWSDNRISPEGRMYLNAGLTLEKDLLPDYFYTDFIKVYSKQSQKKDSVNCPEGLTEHEWANCRGLFRVWDCGKKRWKWEPK